MRKYYQPLHLTVNEYVKRFLKNKFSTWYGNQILKQLDKDDNIDTVDVKILLTTLDLSHVQWVVNF